MEKRLKEELLFLKNLIKIITDGKLPLSKKIDKSLKLLLEKIKGVHGSIMIVEPEKNFFNVVASTNKKLLNKKIPIDPSTISGHVYITGKPLYYKDISRSKRFKHKTHQKNYSTPSLMCIPLKGQNRILGVVTVSDHAEKLFFSKEDFLLLKDYSAILSPLLENSYLFFKLQKEKEKYEKIARELEVTYTEKSELVEMVIHDFKSPLSAVISNLELLKYIGADPKHIPIIETAINGAKKLLDMINDFLNIAKVDNWQKLEPFESISLKEVLKEVIEGLNQLAEEKSISIKINTDEDIMVWGKKSLLFHLFQNLISNGIKYTPEGGEVKIFWKLKEAKRKEDPFKKFCIICVEDNGYGIPDEEKKIIFEKFKRLKRDKNKSLKGTGIGLFICKKIANILGGKIWVEDVKPRGSRFCVTCYVGEKENG